MRASSSPASSTWSSGAYSRFTAITSGMPAAMSPSSLSASRTRAPSGSSSVSSLEPARSRSIAKSRTVTSTNQMLCVRHPLRPMRDRLNVTPQLYARITFVALGALALIVLTGAAVRLTGSGLGCPDWPKCYGRTVAPLEYHAVIEYTNRLLSGFVGIAVIAAGALAWFRRPFRWHLALFGGLLPVGVIGQAVLGALVVKHHLAPGLVMSHFILSMILLDSAFALAWCARYEPGERPRSSDRLGVWAVRALVPIGQLTIVAGTIATASGPHAGSHGETLVKRFDFRGGNTLHWVVERHGAIAAVFGLALCAVWLLLRREGGERRAL